MRLIPTAALVLAAMTLGATEARAQMSVSVAAGAALPMGDASDALSMGYNATVGLGIKPPLAPVGLRVEGMFNSWDYKSDFSSLGLNSQRTMALIANATLSGPAMPAYLIGGVGMYNSKVDTDAGASDAENDFGFNIGGGVNLPLTGFSTFLEVRYHHIPVDGGSFKFVPITVGIKF